MPMANTNRRTATIAAQRRANPPVRPFAGLVISPCALQEGRLHTLSVYLRPGAILVS